jgi:hypothetical protein
VVIMMSWLGLRQTQFYSILIKKMKSYNVEKKPIALPTNQQQNWEDTRERLLLTPQTCYVENDF